MLTIVVVVVANMVLRLAIACLLPTTALGACLVNATAPETRKNLVNPVTGEEYPVGVWVAQWAAGYATSYVMGILIEEMLGFNVTYSEGPGTVEGYYAITGCTTPLNTTDRGCGPNGPNVSYQHIQSEAWMGGYEDIWRLVTMMENHPRVAASMGYAGKIAQYFPRGVLEAAYADAGLALDFYTGFDADWNDPASYFDPVSNVNRSHLKKCVDSLMNSPDLIAQYFAVSGDTAGLTTNAAGEQVGYCPDGYFWISPKCRADQSKCIPYFTGGQGYGIVEVMQKAAKWNIPLALGVGATYALYTQLPSMHKSMFYWWVPDPTFLHLEALPSTFPATDKIAIAKGDQTTEMASINIAKIVSKDFSALAPRVNSFVERMTISMDNLNALLLEQIQTGVDWKTMACYWLQNNTDLWSDWLPDESTCFSKFGMYRESTEEFVDNRDGSTDGISCRPCPSGTYSKQLSDDKGVTYICEPCAPGTSQVSGASLSCVPCERGMFQDVPGQLLCKRCAVGSYQDEEGGPLCKKCPENSRTLQQGSLTIFDCGCEESYIDVAEGAAKAAGNLSCVACQEGLSCPVMGTLESLVSGSNPRGTEHLPTVTAGYFVTAEDPLEVYKCGKITQCPGGLPAQCSGGLIGVPCAQCPEGSTTDGDSCEVCKPELQVLWFVGVGAVFLFLTAAYYLMTSKVTAKASVLFTTTCAFGMLISLLQSIGIIGTMTVEFPVDVKGIFSWMSIFVLELDNFGFACLAGSATPPRYMVSVLFFPLGLAWFALNYGVSQLVPKYRWDLTKTFACMGQFLQVGFSTMSAIALAPLTCYTHPNQQQSLLKYPNVICGSTDHSIMLVGGVLLLCVGVLGFLCLCSYAALKVPEWSAMEKHARVRAFRFLVFRFRLDSWWFGVPLLTRGPLIALPIVLATDYPAIQSVWVTFILLCFLACQALAWPWKVPLLNALDCWMSYCIMILVAGSALYLEPINKVGVVAQFVDNFTTGIMVVIFGSIGAMVLMALTALVHRSAMGGHAEYAVFNLGRTPKPEIVAQKLKEMGELLAQMETKDVEKAFDALAVFDTRRITTFMTMMSAEVLIERGDLSYGSRVASSSFSGAPKPRSSNASVRSRDSQQSTASAKAAKA